MRKLGVGITALVVLMVVVTGCLGSSATGLDESPGVYAAYEGSPDSGGYGRYDTGTPYYYKGVAFVGECVSSCRSFYREIYEIVLPCVSVGNYGAYLYWDDDRVKPSSEDMERIENNGSNLPIEDDMLVFRPTSGNVYGHVAVVKSAADRDNVVVIESNVVPPSGHSGGERTISRSEIDNLVYGWYRPLGNANPDLPITPPPANSNIEDVYRTTRVAWSTANLNGIFYAVHTGESDKKIYKSSRDLGTGTWSSWDPSLPDCATNCPVSIAGWNNKLVLAFTGLDGKIWIGTLDNGTSNWSGWQYTNRTSTHGPSLASDGTNMWLIHKGFGNDRIYYSNDAPWFQNNWIDSNRDSKDRPSAAVSNGNLYIAHRGANNNEIYYANVTVAPNNWIDTRRSSLRTPSIAILNGQVWIGHQGLTDNRNYVGRPGIEQWITLDETTSTEPFIIGFNNQINYCFVNVNSMRIRRISP